jgi:hypothetical protein
MLSVSSLARLLMMFLSLACLGLGLYEMLAHYREARALAAIAGRLRTGTAAGDILAAIR